MPRSSACVWVRRWQTAGRTLGNAGGGPLQHLRREWAEGRSEAPTRRYPTSETPVALDKEAQTAL